MLETFDIIFWVMVPSSVHIVHYIKIVTLRWLGLLQCYYITAAAKVNTPILLWNHTLVCLD